MHFTKNYYLHWTGNKYIYKYALYIYNTHIFSILGVAFAAPILCFFQKLQLLEVKNFELIFAALYFYLYVFKKCISEL